MNRIFTDITLTIDVTDMHPKHYESIVKVLQAYSEEPLNFESYNGDTLAPLTDEQKVKLNEVRSKYESSLATGSRRQF